MLDLLIKDGMVVDGTGSPGFYAAVAVEGDTVRVLRGDVSQVKAKRVLDATGRVVCPGFIDLHAHSALMILHDPKHLPKVHQGVTTELIGIDGNSYAPFAKQSDLQDFIQLNSGLEGAPPIKATWSSVSDYLAVYDAKVSVNIAYIVGNSPLRIGAMGWNDRRPTAKEMDRMKGLLRESMGEGAFGMSTGLDYPPGSYADTAELVELSKEGAKLGGFYHTHVRYPLGDGYLDPYKEAIDIGRRSGIPIHVTHLLPGGHGRYRGSKLVFELVEGARDEGMDITFDCFPYSHGGTRLIYYLPPWTHDGGPRKIIESLKSPEARERLRKEVKPSFGRGGWSIVYLTYFKKAHNQRFEGRSVAEAAEMTEKDPVDFICDLLLDEDLQVSYQGESIDPEVLPEYVVHPLQMVASDALLLGDFPPSMSYGTFPIIIAKYVREERKLTLPDAIRKMTSYPAQRLGLKYRGILRDQMKADIVVFDYENISAPTTRRDPKQLPTGVDYVIVNGQVVLDHGKHTGVMAGRALTRGRD